MTDSGSFQLVWGCALQQLILAMIFCSGRFRPRPHTVRFFGNDRLQRNNKQESFCSEATYPSKLEQFFR